MVSAYQAIVALESIDSLQSLNSAHVCAAAASGVTDDLQLENAFYATHVLSRLRLLLSSFIRI